MGFWTDWSKSPAADYPDGLANDPPADALPRRGWTLVSLVLLCLVLRGIDMLRCDFPWTDSVFYLQLSERLAQDDYGAAFRHLGLNVYPVILMV